MVIHDWKGVGNKVSRLQCDLELGAVVVKEDVEEVMSECMVMADPERVRKRKFWKQGTIAEV